MPAPEPLAADVMVSQATLLMAVHGQEGSDAPTGKVPDPPAAATLALPLTEMVHVPLTVRATPTVAGAPPFNGVKVRTPL